MCVKAALILRSPLRPLLNSHTVIPFTATPTSPTMTMTKPPAGSGWIRRRIASQAIAPVAISSRMALASADRIDERRRPYV